MEACRDFIQWLGPDMALHILMCLDDPCDLVRVGSVSSSWRQFGELTFAKLSALTLIIILSFMLKFSTPLIFCESVFWTAESSQRVKSQLSKNVF